MDELIGGRFRIVGVLGEGAMGVVYRAFDEVLARELALKEMRVPAGVDAQEALERFVTEARAAARLSDRSIVTVHDVLQDGARVLIAMELLNGMTLADTLQMVGQGIAADQVRDVMGAVAGALAVAHGEGVVHRDLKPDNVFWLESGRVVVTDFGLARIGSGRGTQIGTVMGTPGYMAPEQIRGDVVGPAADVFAWGALTYELLTGVPAFGGPDLDPTAWMWRVVHEPAPVLDLPVDPVLASVVDWALQKDPKARPADGHALLEALGGAIAAPVAGRVTSLPPATPNLAAPSTSGRSRGLVAGVAAAGATVLAAIIVLVVVLAGGGPETAPVTELLEQEPDFSDTGEAEEEATAGIPAGYERYDGELFETLYPASWQVKRAEELVKGGSWGLRDTTFTGDPLDLAVIRANTMVGRPNNDPRDAMQEAYRGLRGRPDYIEIGLADEQLTVASGTYPAVRWEYETMHPSQPVRLHSVNYFIDGGTFSLAFLTRSAAEDFDRFADQFDLVRSRLTLKESGE